LVGEAPPQGAPSPGENLWFTSLHPQCFGRNPPPHKKGVINSNNVLPPHNIGCKNPQPQPVLLTLPGLFSQPIRRPKRKSVVAPPHLRNTGYFFSPKTRCLSPPPVVPPKLFENPGVEKKKPTCVKPRRPGSPKNLPRPKRSPGARGNLKPLAKRGTPLRVPPLKNWAPSLALFPSQAQIASQAGHHREIPHPGKINFPLEPPGIGGYLEQKVVNST